MFAFEAQAQPQSAEMHDPDVEATLGHVVLCAHDDDAYVYKHATEPFSGNPLSRRLARDLILRPAEHHRTYLIHHHGVDMGFDSGTSTIYPASNERTSHSSTRAWLASEFNGSQIRARISAPRHRAGARFQRFWVSPRFCITSSIILLYVRAIRDHRRTNCSAIRRSLTDDNEESPILILHSLMSCWFTRI